jgi:hypothetical protein
MDKTVPPGAALLLAHIYRTETGVDAPACYQVIFGNNQDKLPKPLTSMTLDEIEKAQATWTKKFGSSAMGAGQFMKNTLDAPGTLRDIEGEMGLTGREKATPDLQDRIAYHLLKRRGYDAFIAGEITRTEFGKRLAMEWASFPVLADTKGRHRTVKRGQSYYAGDGLNKALVAPERVEGWLDEVYAVANAPAVPAEPAVEDYEHDIAPVPAKPSKPAWLHLALIFGAAVLVGLAVFFLGHAPAEEVDLLGPPVPHDRPFGLLGGGSNVFADIGLQIALAFVMPLVSAAATAAVGWIVYWWQRVLKADFDQKSRDALHDALERGMLAAIEAFGPKAKRSTLLSTAADYAEQFNGKTIKNLKISRSELVQLAVPHLVTAKQRS